MDMLAGFNAQEATGGIPEGTQATCIVTKYENKPTRNGDGAYLNLTIQILDGPHKGETVWAMFLLQHPDPTTVKFAKARASKLCLAVGVPNPRSSDEILNKPFRATFGKPEEFNGEMQSRIKKFDPVGGSTAVANGLTQTPGQDASKPAWAR